MIDTRTGNVITSHSPQAVALYREAVDLILGSESGAAETLDKALMLNQGFALAAAARYCVAKDVGESDAGIYRELAQRTALHASDWEREHIDVLIGLLDEPAASLTKARAYIDLTPGDLLVVSQLSGYLFFYGGPTKLEAVLKLFESVEGALANDWAFLARLGFAASEAALHKRGRDLIERAMELRPQALIPFMVWHMCFTIAEQKKSRQRCCGTGSRSTRAPPARDKCTGMCNGILPWPSFRSVNMRLRCSVIWSFVLHKPQHAALS